MRTGYRAELFKQLRRGVPVSIAALCRRSIDALSLSFVGRLGADAMAGASLASSMMSVFALSIFVGLSSATVTFTSQARGAGDTSQAAYWLHRALVVHSAVAVPLTCLLMLLAPLLRLMGQDPQLASKAGQYCALLLPGMWAWAWAWCLSPWLQSHGVTMPQLLVSIVVIIAHFSMLSLLFAAPSAVDARSAAIATSASLSLN